ncbi:hypothetical protein EDB81DRAFT_888200 [Dactylonectria macrodidyma]|uniref:Polyketide synthase n=1 Tax=Dactylonectria macrodidyma TaxID=307937 RepID=A0A9P9E4G9_9HYPO|nr:hypothetical protein EDB81DRAFT_888200 [Dactylonectria macrodidyma]
MASTASNMNEPIAIVGSSCRFPGGASSPSKLWSLLHDPVDLKQEIPSSRFNPNGFFNENGEFHGSTNVKHSYLTEEDPRLFDHSFFNTTPKEAESMDPQQRILLETVYEGVERAGYTIQQLKGSQTAVFVGLMNNDYYDVLARDMDSAPIYSSTGTAISIVSNRVAYFFDWKGPAWTVDTACSSSLVALHSAVQTLRNGEASMAVAAGVNLILGPTMYIFESKLHMLSPNGRSRMWDKDVDGYARGEGFASVILKTLSQAIADNDHIECIIRGTGVNQDGRTKGITMPNPVAQTALIQATYARSGLDLSKPEDRPQYFEAHGTGTPAGDPLEASTVQSVFFPGNQNPYGEKLHVGSIKTIIGHTEGTAGIAGVLKASLAMQHGIIPPNLHFDNLNPTVKPFYDHLRVPTEPTPWPARPAGVPMRVSVNSFGFGGTNAHAILESYEPAEIVESQTATSSHVGPFQVSAYTQKALQGAVKTLAEELKEKSEWSLEDLAYTLSRRGDLGFKASFSAVDKEQLVEKLEAAAEDAEFGTRATVLKDGALPRILGVFTGQGAQWPTMGVKMYEQSQLFRKTIDELDESLRTLPDPPTWTLAEQLQAPAATSEVHKAAVSQPVCAALQVGLVNVLHAAGIQFKGVVGHSSGEIGAAYAAGYLSAQDAVRIAYYRGVVAPLARGPDGKVGKMMAVGMTLEEATDFCNRDEFAGKIAVAACNGSSSITLSGDGAAVDQAKAMLDEKKTFARVLKVEIAYHSHHMKLCAGAYLDALARCGVQVIEKRSSDCTWYSSVHGFDATGSFDAKDLQGQYWADNMCGAVRFSQALQMAVKLESEPYDMVLEVGPHPALKGPATESLKVASDADFPYIGVLKRGQNDAVQFCDALGFIWEQFSSSSTIVNLAGLREAWLGAGASQPNLIKDLPTYCWDHDKILFKESRLSKAYRTRENPIHELLGSAVVNGQNNQEVRWRQIMRVDEMEWLRGHVFQGQLLFPAAGYVAMAIEAGLRLTDRSVQMVELKDLRINKAITLDEDSSGMEVVFIIRITERKANQISAEYSCYSGDVDASTGQDVSESNNFSGRLVLELGEQIADALPSRVEPVQTMNELATKHLYMATREIGLDYTGDFVVESVKRRLDAATVTVKRHSNKRLRVHPATLDATFHALFAAFSSPGDGRLWCPYLPTSIGHIRVNMMSCPHAADPEHLLVADCNLTQADAKTIRGDIGVFCAADGHAEIQVGAVHCSSFTAPSPANDVKLYAQNVWRKDVTSGLELQNNASSSSEAVLAAIASQITFRYPAANIVQVGSAVDDVATSTVVEALSHQFRSYTYTDASEEAVESAKEAFRDQSYWEKMTFKTLDVGMDLKEQAFKAASSDLVFALNLRKASRTGAVEEALQTCRDLLKAGGYLLLSDEDEETLDWDSMLRTAGFSGVDVISSNVMLTQAVDDRITALRGPLAASVKPETIPRVADLLLVGADSDPVVASLISNSTELLKSFADKVTIVQSLDKASVPKGAAVIVFSDLTSPIFQDMTEETFAGIHRLLENAGYLLWATKGSKTDEPYENMMVGLGRSILQETPDLKLQFLDTESGEIPGAQVFAEALARLLCLGSDNFEDVLWSLEHELVFRDGQVYIPRVLPNSELNDRHNSDKRIIPRTVTLADTPVEVTETEDGSLVLGDAATTAVASGRVHVRVTASSAYPVHTSDGKTYYLAIGSLVSGQKVLALSTTNGSQLDLPASQILILDANHQSDVEQLSQLVESALASSLVSGVQDGGMLWLHQAEDGLAQLVSEAAKEANVQLFFTSSTSGSATSSSAASAASSSSASSEAGEILEVQFVHPLIAAPDLVALKPLHVDGFVDLQQPVNQSLDKLIRSSVQPSATVQDLFTHANGKTALRLAMNETTLRSLLLKSRPSVAAGDINVLPIDKVSSVLDDTLSPATIIDWSAANEVTLRVNPINTTDMFSANKTYLLVGLTGDVGMSLCEFMVQNGARHIVVTSRNPKIDPLVVRHLHRQGASLRAVPLDITNKDSLIKLAAEMKATMPPIGGVANGAMVLRDKLFENMSWEDFQTTANPKVLGSRYLDEVFHSDDLEFFVLFSSVASIMGNSGQANYNAANQFMTTLAHQRRRRGVAGSVIHIAMLLGIGYVMRSTEQYDLLLNKFRNMTVSEGDFRAMFAEAVHAGRPGSDADVEIGTGFARLTPDGTVWQRNPRFSHFFIDEATESSSGGKQAGGSLKEQISAAQDESEALDLLETGAVGLLGRLLHMDGDKIDRQAPLMNLGIDSLVAVQVRSWFMKEIGVDVPVLKILSDATLSDIGKGVLARLAGAAEEDKAQAPGEVAAVLANSAIDWEKEIESLLEGLPVYHGKKSVSEIDSGYTSEHEGSLDGVVSGDTNGLVTRVSTLINEEVNRSANSLINGLTSVKKDGLTVVITGTTGFLGKHVLRGLLADPRVKTVNCIAIRPDSNGQPRHVGIDDPKIVEFSGNLTDERLGLSEAEFAMLARTADAIIHNGADVSFLKSYPALRQTNVVSLRILVEMALQRRVPVTFVSTAAVALFSPDKVKGLHETSASHITPPPDGVRGYASSKWAGEMFLEGVAARHGLPCYIHRAVNIVGEGAPETDLVTVLNKYCKAMQAVPQMDDTVVDGDLDIIEVDEVAEGMVASAIQATNVKPGVPENPLHIINYCQEVKVKPNELHDYYTKKLGMPLKHWGVEKWLDEASELGLDVMVEFFLRESYRSGKPILAPVLWK